MKILFFMMLLMTMISCGGESNVSQSKNNCRNNEISKGDPVLAICTKDEEVVYNDSLASCKGSCCNLVSQIKKSCKSINGKMARIRNFEPAGRANSLRFEDNSSNINKIVYINDLYLQELVAKANEGEQYYFKKNEYSTAKLNFLIED